MDDVKPLLFKHKHLMLHRSHIGRKNRLFFVLCAVVCVFLIFWANERYGNSLCCYLNLDSLPSGNTWNSDNSSDLFDFSSEGFEAKHFYTDIDGWCAGVSNMLFRIASLYGVGKKIHRIPCLQGRCSVDYQKELHINFPALTNYPMRTKCWNEKAYSISFANSDPRIYENTSKLEKLNDMPNLQLKSSYLQEVKFFEDVRPQIREMFKFSQTVDQKVDAYAKEMFNESSPLDRNSSNTKTKVCIHMRGTDFISNKYLPLLPSLIEFTVPSLRFMTELAMNETGEENVSVVLFSDDSKFLKVVVSQFRTFNNKTAIYIPDKLKRLEYMNLASRYCDYYLLTASGSTYGWWSAYLIDDSRQNKVFYNARIFRPHRKDSAKNFVESNFFPVGWRRLVLDAGSQTVLEQDRNEIPLVAI